MLQPVCKISKASIEHQNIYKFYIRASSNKETQQQNMERMIFFRYNHMIYHLQSDGQMEFVDDCNTFREINKNLVMYFVKGSSRGSTDTIKFMKFNYSEYFNGLVYEEISGRIDDFQVQEKSLLLLVKGSTESRFSRLLKILSWGSDLRGKLKHSIEVDDKNFIGSFRTTEVFANGAISTQNKSYFILTSLKTPKIHEYKEVLPLEDGDIVQFCAPKINITYRRMMYLKRNHKEHTPKTCIILPFLNENYITFNVKQNLVQFNNFFEYSVNSKLDEKRLAILSLFPTL
eukprot:CAMPEP_0170554506 /NCGR_PEP_ID=MMETSP0211-20121228/12349_1 /TAXON_ID=311385 /ORGANISM="Pseudokeronopsis sp., Strain OXSARD2" /LENGTH=287 /DNA_ID=CAMNT_0010863609 /DNA_START=1273 /DNA_END=2136 /DNA_ORIENTATION=+